MAFVADCSFVLEWALASVPDPKITTLAERILPHGFIVPAIWPLVITNVILQRARSKNAQNAADQMFANLIQLPFEVDRRTPDLAWTRIVALARRHGLTTYDAAYLELAIRRDAALATLDKALATAGRSEGIMVVPE